MYQPRTYRHWVKDKGLVGFNIVVKETDLYIRAVTDLERKARRLVLKYRRILESYIERHPAFLTSLEPLAVGEDAPRIATEMAAAARKAGVGPMAAVAGAIAEVVGSQLLESSPEVIVENGGDIYLRSLNKRLIGIYAGESPLTGNDEEIFGTAMKQEIEELEKICQANREKEAELRRRFEKDKDEVEWN